MSVHLLAFFSALVVSARRHMHMYDECTIGPDTVFYRRTRDNVTYVLVNNTKSGFEYMQKAYCMSADVMSAAQAPTNVSCWQCASDKDNERELEKIAVVAGYAISVLAVAAFLLTFAAIRKRASESKYTD